MTLYEQRKKGHKRNEQNKSGLMNEMIRNVKIEINRLDEKI